MSPMSTALVRPAEGVLWELRYAWASGKRVSLLLTDDAGRRIEGHVRHVSATGASVDVNGELIPTDRILGVHTPSRWMDEDTTWEPGEVFHGRERRYEPQTERLPNPSGWDG